VTICLKTKNRYRSGLFLVVFKNGLIWSFVIHSLEKGFLWPFIPTAELQGIPGVRDKKRLPRAMLLGTSKAGR